jgi:recombination protein RecA
LTNGREVGENALGEQKANIIEAKTRPLPFLSSRNFLMPVPLAQLRAEVELALAGRVASPFALPERRVEFVSTGIAEVDALAGGVPRGALTEIFGPAGSGRTSLLFSALGARTSQAEACALVDGSDAFDPQSADAAGIDLKRLLWVRCRTLEQSFRATDFLLAAGGFGFIALDLGDTPGELVHRVPLETWFRFRRAVEGTPTILFVLEEAPHAKTCASLVLQVEAERSRWNLTAAQEEEGAAGSRRHPFSRLFDSSDVRAELVRSRTPQGVKTDFRDGRDLPARNGKSTVFEAREIFGAPRSRPT